MHITSPNFAPAFTSRMPSAPLQSGAETSDHVAQSNNAPDALSDALPSAQLKKVLNDKILAQLEKTLRQEGGPSIYALDAEDFTPEKVASRVLGFVGQALRGLDQGSEAYASRLDQARRGVERGFNDAKDVLESLGALSGQVKQNAEDTYDLIQQGLAELAQNGVQRESFASQSASLQRTVAIEVLTKDGDKVTINVERGLAISQSHHAKQQDGQRSEVNVRGLSAQLDVSYSVSGELDDKELAAIDGLVKQINDVSSTFFEQDTQSALTRAAQIGYDTDELVGYSFKLQETKQVRVTEAYRGVEQMGKGSSDQPNLADLVKPLKDFLNNFASAAKNVEASALFANADKAFLDLFNGVVRSDGKQAAQLSELESHLGKPLEQFTAGLLASVKKSL